MPLKSFCDHLWKDIDKYLNYQVFFIRQLSEITDKWSKITAVNQISILFIFPNLFDKKNQQQSEKLFPFYFNL